MPTHCIYLHLSRDRASVPSTYMLIFLVTSGPCILFERHMDEGEVCLQQLNVE